MVSVKMLKPYYIKMNPDYIRVILAYQYFSLLINKKVYHFVPIEGKEIRINRRTKQVVNTETKFAFQKGKDIIHITMKKLTTLKDFMELLDSIVKPYYEPPLIEGNIKREINRNEIDVNDRDTLIIKELERQNVKRLIDKALDERDEKMFRELVKRL